MKARMHRWIGSAIVLLMCAAGAAPGNASDEIPSYYSHLDFNLTSPGTQVSAVGGFANPAVYRMLPDSEMWFYWSDDGAKLRSLPKWGWFFGSSHLGFGMIHSRFASPPAAGSPSVTDYQLSLAWGNRTTSMGAAFGWSGGDEELAGRSRVIRVGSLHRFGRNASLGLVGAFATDTDARSGLVDVAVRPLGDRRLTLFADAEMQRKTRLEDALWSAGAMVEPLPGLQITGRYFEDEGYAVSVGFSFGALGVSASPRFDKENDLQRTLYGARLGFRERNIYDTHLAKNSSYLSMTLTGKVRYRKYRLFDDKTQTLHSILTSLESAKSDPQIRGVALNLSGAGISRGKAWEIKEKLKAIHNEGKHVIVYIDEADMTLYHLASAADRIVMDPAGLIMLPGYVMGRTFMVGLLGKLGLGVDEWRFFKYKSAFESLSREGMSEPDREQRYALIEGYYNEMRADVAQTRGISADEFDRWINEDVVITPAVALSNGMVDKLGRWEDVKDVIRELEGSPKRMIPPKMLADRLFHSTLWGENPRVAVVYGLGECAMDKGINARKLEKIFRGLRSDRRVKAVVFRVDSPGGSGMASDVVAEALRKCAERKPVIVSQGDVAGSGGYWISMYGTEILALPTTITGSIGVIGGWVWNDGIGEKTGLKSDFVHIGEHADLMTGVVLPLLGMQIPNRNLNESEREQIEELFLDFYNEFVTKVAAGRKMDKDAVADIAQGRVWTGRAGLANGLIDRIGGMELALQIARDKAGIDPDEEVDVVEYPPAPWFNLGPLFRSPIPFLGRLRGESNGPDSVAENYAKNYELIYLQEIAKHNGQPLYLVPPEVLTGINGIFWKY
jgi:protease-4